MTARGTLGLVGILTGALLASSPVLAQANGDPGSALLGIARAQAHSEARSKSNMNPTGQQIAPDPATSSSAKGGQQAVANKDHHG